MTKTPTPWTVEKCGILFQIFEPGTSRIITTCTSEKFARLISLTPVMVNIIEAQEQADFFEKIYSQSPDRVRDIGVIKDEIAKLRREVIVALKQITNEKPRQRGRG